eukprot:1786485-Amphidinium_carterae.1
MIRCTCCANGSACPKETELRNVPYRVNAPNGKQRQWGILVHFLKQAKQIWSCKEFPDSPCLVHDSAEKMHGRLGGAACVRSLRCGVRSGPFCASRIVQMPLLRSSPQFLKQSLSIILLCVVSACDGDREAAAGLQDATMPSDLRVVKQFQVNERRLHFLAEEAPLPPHGSGSEDTC